MIIAVSPKRPASQAMVRRLHHGHFAFMRGLIQGMDERSAWTRYLQEEGTSSDLRHVRRTVIWIRDTFAAAAKREQRPGTARLILLDPSRFAQQPAAKIPTLEEFAAAQDLEDFSEDEQLEAFLSAYPQGGPATAGVRATNRREKVISRQLEALRWLERLVVHDPKPLDAVQAWISPSTAARLRTGGVHTLQDLATLMNMTGARWWRAFPGIGKYKAARVGDWMRTHGAQLGMEVGEYALTPRSQLRPEVLAKLVVPGPTLVPIEKFVPPCELDGRAGTNRRQWSSSKFETDLAAVGGWIAAKACPDEKKMDRLTATQRSYRKEAERLLLWSVLVRAKPLSSLGTTDISAYLAFVESPPSDWCAPRSTPRWSPQWRPLEGPLSPAAQKQAKIVVHGLFAFLVQSDYLALNPCTALMRRSTQPSASETVNL
ncbi:MAG: hypothetical protein EON54_02540 [Alcaligenaceae bacterium]|nr:MAG: hypothetical protein EON54_02540 [Alcaligenaceae bacterium]